MNKDYLMSLDNDVAINIRLPKEVRALFSSYGHSHLLDSSAVIRSLMLDFI